MTWNEEQAVVRELEEMPSASRLEALPMDQKLLEMEVWHAGLGVLEERENNIIDEILIKQSPG